MASISRSNWYWKARPLGGSSLLLADMSNLNKIMKVGGGHQSYNSQA